MTGYVNEAVTPKLSWKCVHRGYHSTGTVYVSRTRYGWAYGVVVADDEIIEHGQTTRPIGRAKVLAEALVAS